MSLVVIAFQTNIKLIDAIHKLFKFPFNSQFYFNINFFFALKVTKFHHKNAIVCDRSDFLHSRK